MSDSIHVISGSADGEFDHLVGRTVGELRKALTPAFNIPTNAVAFVNGEKAKASVLLEPGDRVEFIKPARTKKRKGTAEAADHDHRLRPDGEVPDSSAALAP